MNSQQKILHLRLALRQLTRAITQCTGDPMAIDNAVAEAQRILKVTSNPATEDFVDSVRDALNAASLMGRLVDDTADTLGKKDHATVVANLKVGMEGFRKAWKKMGCQYCFTTGYPCSRGSKDCREFKMNGELN